MRKELIVVVGQQRSGTTALHRALAETGYVEEFGEVFHNGEEQMKNKSNYYYYLKNILTPHASIVANNSVQEKAFIAYIDYLKSLSDKPYFLIDIKYISWHHFNPVWQNIFDKPIMLKVLENMNAIMIHMIRMNVFAQFVSMEVAEATDKWHYNSKDKVEKDELSLRMPPPKAMKYMKNSKDNSRLFRAFLRPNKKTIELIYEYTYDEQGMTKYALDRLRRHLNKDLIDKIFVPLKKTPRNIKDVVKNKEELREFFSGKEFEDLVGITLYQ